jgi:hypothetical protein
MSTGDYRYALPSAFAIPQQVVVFDPDDERNLVLLDQHIFDHMFPKPDERSNGKPAYYCIKNDELWFDRGADSTYPIRLDFQTIPADMTSQGGTYGVSAELTEMARVAMINYAASDIFDQIGSIDRAARSEEKGNLFVRALQKRYEMLQSPEAAWDYMSKYFPDDEWRRLGW